MEAPTTALVGARPKAIDAAYTGRYADVLRGWEAQATKFRRYLAEECRAARLSTAAAQALLELAGSEFWATVDQSAQKAVGEVVMTRTGTLPAGAIKSGHRFARSANPDAVPEVKAAQYVATSPVYVKSGQSDFTIPIEATAAGLDANVVQVSGIPPGDGASVDTVFDPLARFYTLAAAGGSNGVDDPWTRLYAAATYCGQFGPVDSALIAGAFEVPRVRRAALVTDTTRGIAKLFIADVSWTTSDKLNALVAQNIHDRWLGWGARCEVRPVRNSLINVSANVTLKGPQYLDDTATISEVIRTALLNYFDERPDFYSWRIRTLRGLISQCDSRILTCSSAVVLDSSGTPLPEPPAKLNPASSYVLHYLLSGNAVDINYSIPG